MLERWVSQCKQHLQGVLLIMSFVFPRLTHLSFHLLTFWRWTVSGNCSSVELYTSITNWTNVYDAIVCYMNHLFVHWTTVFTCNIYSSIYIFSSKYSLSLLRIFWFLSFPKMKTHTEGSTVLLTHQNLALEVHFIFQDVIPCVDHSESIQPWWEPAAFHLWH